MLFPIVLLLSVAFTSVIADISDDIDECGSILDFEDMENVLDMPDADELESLCSPFLTFMGCVEDVIKIHTGFTMEELRDFIAHHENVRFIDMFINVRSTIQDLCDENSQLNKDYRENAECLNRVLEEDKSGLCYKVADAAYEAHHGIENEIEENDAETEENGEEEEGDDDDGIFGGGCMYPAYQTACKGIDIHEQCGEKAFDTFMQIVRRTTLFRTGICTEEQLAEAKTKFFEHLDEEAPHRDLFSLAFDLKKRRK